ncbi:S8 family serine peptidase [Sorangium sp. So ce118]
MKNTCTFARLLFLPLAAASVGCGLVGEMDVEEEWADREVSGGPAIEVSNNSAENHEIGGPSDVMPESVGNPKQRRFARNIGQAAPVASIPADAPIPGTLLVDAQTKETNELVVLLNYESSTRLSQIVPGLPAGAAAPALERAFLKASLARSPRAIQALGNPAHIRYAVPSERMPDADRVTRAKLTPEAIAAGFKYDPRERLERYFVVRYDSIERARTAAGRITKDAAFAYVSNNIVATMSSSPNDAYFSVAGVPAHYQWGARVMTLPAAWDITSGQSFIGILDQDWPGFSNGVTLTVHPDLKSNFRQHMVGRSLDQSSGGRNHTVHVAGIIAAQHNNKTNDQSGWVAGACPECSFVTYPASLATSVGSTSDYANLLRAAVEGGMQAINWSGGFPGHTCPTVQVICDALGFATQRGVLVVSASGNSNLSSGPQFPGNTHDGSAYGYSVLPVGGISPSGLRWNSGGSGPESGSNWPSSYGVVAPAKSIPSTFIAGETYPGTTCSDASAANDESSGRFPNGVGDGVGSCTGTSMAAPHITGLAGLVWSVNPRATADGVRSIIRQSGDRAGSPSPEYGHGLPDAPAAVNSALATNPTRLTPLFSYYSGGRLDSFDTTVPQMARAAAYGTMHPRAPGSASWDNAYSPSYHGTWITGYQLPQNGASWGGDTSTFVKAQVWIFTTSVNPKNGSAPLRPLYRLSWKCSDPTSYPPAVCSTTPYHVDTVLVGKDELAFFTSPAMGYKVDGLEGFIYPPNQPQPPGTVRLMRKYNPSTDDHAVFPETATSAMFDEGYTTYSNSSDWLGYVYPNTGSIPTIQ